MAAIVSTPDILYTEKEFEPVRTELETICKNRGILTDFSSTNVITTILDLLAYLSDKLAYQQNAEQRESFFTTCRLRASILRHAAKIGYQAAGRVAATVPLKIELLQASAYDIEVPANTLFKTTDKFPTSFRLLEDLTIPAGAIGSYVEVYIENSLSFSEPFTADGSKNQKITSARTRVLLSGIQSDGTADPDVLQIYVGGLQFTIVDSLVSSGPADRHVVVGLTNSGNLTLEFGDGVTGAAPSGSGQILGRYGGGSQGNAAVITFGPALVNVNGDPISVEYSTAIVSSGGADEESIEEIRINAPRSLKVNDRTVSLEDFVINAEAVSGIDRALALTSNEDPTIDENKTVVYVVTDSPTNSQLIGGNAAATSITSGVDDDVAISINGEAEQTFSLGTQASGEDIAAALQAAIRAATPEFPLDNADAYGEFTVEYDTVDQRYILTTGQAGLSASIEIGTGANDASVVLKLTTLLRNLYVSGAEPSAAAVAALTTVYDEDKPVMATHEYEILGPVIKVVNYDFRVRFDAAVSTDVAKADLRDRIRSDMQTFFSPVLSDGSANPEIDFERTIRFSDSICIPNDVPGIESVDEDFFLMNGVADDVVLGTGEFPALGGITVRDEDGNII